MNERTYSTQRFSLLAIFLSFYFAPCGRLHASFRAHVNIGSSHHVNEQCFIETVDPKYWGRGKWRLMGRLPNEAQRQWRRQEFEAFYPPSFPFTFPFPSLLLPFPQCPSLFPFYPFPTLSSPLHIPIQLAAMGERCKLSHLVLMEPDRQMHFVRFL